MAGVTVVPVTGATTCVVGFVVVVAAGVVLVVPRLGLETVVLGLLEFVLAVL